MTEKPSFLETVLSRKSFLKTAGRFTLLTSVLGLGGFLFKRNTCNNPTASRQGASNPCQGCNVLSDCDLPQADSFRGSDPMGGGQ